MFINYYFPPDFYWRRTGTASRVWRASSFHFDRARTSDSPAFLRLTVRFTFTLTLISTLLLAQQTPKIKLSLDLFLIVPSATASPAHNLSACKPETRCSSRRGCSIRRFLQVQHQQLRREINPTEKYCSWNYPSLNWRSSHWVKSNYPPHTRPSHSFCRFILLPKAWSPSRFASWASLPEP